MTDGWYVGDERRSVGAMLRSFPYVVKHPNGDVVVLKGRGPEGEFMLDVTIQSFPTHVTVHPVHGRPEPSDRWEMGLSWRAPRPPQDVQVEIAQRALKAAYLALQLLIPPSALGQFQITEMIIH